MPEIDTVLVRQLLRDQFPAWADLPVKAVEPGGWDNRTFRLGDDLLVRLPSADAYVEQVGKEQHWLPRLAPGLPLPIPWPVAMGRPSATFLWPWSVYRWLAGQPVSASIEAVNLSRLAEDLACFLGALHRLSTADGPPPGEHNFHRGGPLSTYDGETRGAIARLADGVDVTRAVSVWNAASDSRWHGDPVWVHGDMSAGNLLVRDGRLAAVIDFGMLGVGDPACDLVIAWTLFDDPARLTFRTTLGLDEATWMRARGWALWEALITLLPDREASADASRAARRALREILADDVAR